MSGYHGMTDWETITCQNPAPHEHKTIEIEVDLSQRHGYLNYAPIPERLWHPPFKMEVWDWAAAPEASQPVEGEWCPMRCAISQTIVEHGIWEPPETLTLLNLFEAARLSGDQWTFVDMGAQIGWFSMLAGMAGLDLACWEADEEVAAVLERNIERIDPGVWAMIRKYRIDADISPTFLMHPSIVKIDIEGAEPYALRMLEKPLRDGAVRAALIETTPHFGVDVEQMADQMINEYGFTAYLLPPKVDPFVPYDQIHDLTATFDPAQVHATAVEYRQINVLYMQPDMPTIV